MGRPPTPAVDRFAEKVALTESGCLVWLAGVDKDGYGKFRRGGSSGPGSHLRAHRWSYEHHVGPIPQGLVIDHLCRNHACVHPDHLEPVTGRENLMRGETPAASQVKRTHCPAGHPYSGDNLYVTRGQRICRECSRAANRAWYARNRKAN